MNKTHPEFKTEPYWNVIDPERAKSALQGLINAGTRQSQTHLIGEMLAEQIVEGGGLNTLNFPGFRRDNAKPIIKEMIDTAQGQMALLEKVRIDVAFGLADIPLLYGPIYNRIAPPGGFPGGVFQLDEYTLQANVVFLQKFEGQEVEFGTLSKGSPSFGNIATYAAGFMWTEDMIEFDRTYQIEENNRAFGRSYNALLNHLYLSPIIGSSYSGDNLTEANTDGDTAAEDMHLTLQDAYTATVNATPRRTGTVLLASESNRFDIERALLTPVADTQGNPLPNIPVRTIIYYDGEDVERGSDIFSYPGVSAGTAYLIFPQRKLKELVHLGGLRYRDW